MDRKSILAFAIFLLLVALGTLQEAFFPGNQIFLD